MALIAAGPPTDGKAEVLRTPAADRRAAAADRVAAALLLQQAWILRVAAARDHQQAARLRQQAALDRAAASTDELTGVLRRNDGFPALQREVERCRRLRMGLVIGFVDVDALKKINDTRGHTAGDRMLQEVAAGLRASLRSYDVIVRFGGDEFVYSLAGAELGDAISRFEKMRDSLARTTGDSVSAGFAELRQGESLEVLIARADDDLYERRRRTR